MEDGRISNTGNSRLLRIPQNAQIDTLADLVALLKGDGLPVDLLLNYDGWENPATMMRVNKNSLLQDTTATALDLDPTVATPNDALLALAALDLFGNNVVFGSFNLLANATSAATAANILLGAKCKAIFLMTATTTNNSSATATVVFPTNASPTTYYGSVASAYASQSAQIFAARGDTTVSVYKQAANGLLVDTINYMAIIDPPVPIDILAIMNAKAGSSFLTLTDICKDSAAMTAIFANTTSIADIGDSLDAMTAICAQTPSRTAMVSATQAVLRLLFERWAAQAAIPQSSATLTALSGNAVAARAVLFVRAMAQAIFAGVYYTNFYRTTSAIATAYSAVATGPGGGTATAAISASAAQLCVLLNMSVVGGLSSGTGSYNPQTANMKTTGGPSIFAQTAIPFTIALPAQASCGSATVTAYLTASASAVGELFWAVPAGYTVTVSGYYMR